MIINALRPHCCLRRKTIIFPSSTCLENPMLFTVWPKNLFPWRLGIINNLSTNWNVWPRHDVFCLFKSQATPSFSAQLKIPIFHLSYFWIYWTTFNSALSFRSSINPFAASFLKLWLRWIDEGGMLGVLAKYINPGLPYASLFYFKGPFLCRLEGVLCIIGQFLVL